MMVTHFALLFLIASAMMVDSFPQSNVVNTPNGGQETTTRVPPSDPSNAIVFTVPCTRPCPVTYQYSPVCGSDGQTYGNEAVLRCTQRCGKNVTMYLAAACGRNNG